MEPTVLCNAHFITFHRHPRRIYALLLNNGLIEQIYSRKELIPKGVKKIDLHGNYVIPGFIDSHTHLIARGIELQRIDLGKCRSLDVCLEKLHAAARGSDSVVFGSNWDQSAWNEPLPINADRYTLDRISKRKPVVMRRICGHFAIVNTKALHCIPKKWKNIDWENGYLYEDAALNLNEIFQIDDATLKKAIDISAAEATAKGITSVHEIMNPRRLRLLQKVQREKGLKLRFAAYIKSKYLADVVSSGMSSGFGNDMLTFAGIKVYVDGSIGARTAAFKKPYEKTNKRGMILLSIPRLRSIIQTANDNGIQLMVHAIGDRAVTHTLKAFIKHIDKSNPLRHRLEHLEKLDSWSIRTMSNMNMIASMQPNFVRRWQQPGCMYEQYLAARYREMNCFRKILDAGIRVVFGSDCMPVGPLYGIQGAIEHPFSCGRLESTDALRLYTKDAAFATFEEDRKGTIDTGKFADLVVLSKNPLTEKNVDMIKIIMVFVGGKIVYKTTC